MRLWLDDVRDPQMYVPSPWLWTWAKTVPEAQELLLTGEVEEASLDHDLGLCDACWDEARKAADDSPDFKLNLDFQHKMAWNHGLASYASCVHNGTGYDLVCWMEETGNWPLLKPNVHSANPVGRKRMQLAIDRHYGD